MRIVIGPAFSLLLIVAGCSGGPPDPPTASVRPDPVAPVANTMSQADVEREVTRLREALRQEVPKHMADDADGDRAWIARAKAVVDAAGTRMDRPQLLVVVDRNASVQELRIVLAQPNAAWEVIGGSKVSTGQRGRHGYYITPVGVFLHTDDILDYRAQGTFNENHIRGLGLKGMRVWDFGWQTADRGWGAESDPGEIRLLMHATDPDALERRLGRPASKGCVRLPEAMNRFLDRHGILDADYERDAPDDIRSRSVLLPNRQPSPLAGNTMVVVDSSQATISLR
jgi:L,D-transpeptidase-like protein